MYYHNSRSYSRQAPIYIALWKVADGVGLVGERMTDVSQKQKTKTNNKRSWSVSVQPSTKWPVVRYQSTNRWLGSIVMKEANKGNLAKVLTLY